MLDSFVRVRFTASRGLKSRLTCLLTNSMITHVEFGTPRGTWIGAHSGTIMELPGNYMRPLREYVYEIPCSHSQQGEHLKWLRSMLGTRKFDDISGLIFHMKNLKARKRDMSSHLVTAGLVRLFGANRVINVLPEFFYLVTPEDLHLSPIFVGCLVSRKGKIKNGPRRYN